eukprot:2314048-Rhodomonas_salina.1
MDFAHQFYAARFRLLTFGSVRTPLSKAVPLLSFRLPSPVCWGAAVGEAVRLLLQYCSTLTIDSNVGTDRIRQANIRGLVALQLCTLRQDGAASRHVTAPQYIPQLSFTYSSTLKGAATSPCSLIATHSHASLDFVHSRTASHSFNPPPFPPPHPNGPPLLASLASVLPPHTLHVSSGHGTVCSHAKGGVGA